MREWRGVTHTVLVHADGFEWSGRRYRSLTLVAREITGAHWSGPRFFGLRKRAGPSDDGLEQEFNSLDAQREACEAFIVSQRHAGWAALPDMYDDGGLSGATMERPALRRLLSDIKAGKVQIIVVYKVDRLTRSLADFAKIVDVLDAHNASFVSLT